MLSLHSINVRVREGGHPVQEESGISSCQIHRQTLKKMPDGIPFVWTGVSGQSAADPPDLLHCHPVPPAQRLHS